MSHRAGCSSWWTGPTKVGADAADVDWRLHSIFGPDGVWPYGSCWVVVGLGRCEWMVIAWQPFSHIHGNIPCPSACSAAWGRRLVVGTPEYTRTHRPTGMHGLMPTCMHSLMLCSCPLIPPLLMPPLRDALQACCVGSTALLSREWWSVTHLHSCINTPPALRHLPFAPPPLPHTHTTLPLYI